MKTTCRIITLTLIIAISVALVGCNGGNDVVKPTPSPTVFTPTPAPTATPAPLDLNNYAFDSALSLYNIYPLCQREGMALVYVGYLEDSVLALLHISEDGTYGSVGKIELTHGNYTKHYDFTSANSLLTTAPNGYEVISVAPFAFYDSMNRELHVSSADYSRDSSLAIPEGLALDGIFMVDGKVLAYEINHDVLYSIDVIGAVSEVNSLDGELLDLAALSSCTVLYDVDYRYHYVTILSISPDGQYASFYGTDGYTDDIVTFVVDTVSGNVVGQTAERAYITAADDAIYTIGIDIVWEEYACSSTITSKRFDSFEETEVVTSTHAYDNVSLLELFMHNNTANYLFATEDEGYKLNLCDYKGDVTRSVLIDMYRLNKEIHGYTGLPQIMPYACGEAGEVLLPITLGSGMKAVLLWESASYSQPSVEMERGVYHGDALEIAPRVNADYGELTAYANQVGEKHGVTILLGADATLYLASHRVDLHEDENDIRNAIEQLDSTLSKYPDGFMAALCSDGYLEGIVIALTGNIYSTTDYYTDFASAVTSPLDSYRIIAFDISNLFTMESTIFHEFSHIIDARLDAIAPHTEGVVWNEDDWNAMNPPDFTYYNAYLDPNGFAYIAVAPPTYTPEGEEYRIHNNVESVYFLDRYAKTYATEDRAMLFEYVATFGYQAGFLQSPHIIAKLQYYFTAVRQMLDPNGLWTEPTCWELALEKLIENANAG